jgi:hypothetical protein
MVSFVYNLYLTMAKRLTPQTYGQQFRQLKSLLSRKVSPAILFFIKKSWGNQRDSLNSGTLIIHCNLWRLDDKMPNSDGSTNQNQWFFPHFQSFSFERNGGTTRCEIRKNWRSDCFHGVSGYLRYCFQIYVGIHLALLLDYLISTVCISRYLYSCEMSDLRAFCIYY